MDVLDGCLVKRLMMKITITNGATDCEQLMALTLITNGAYPFNSYNDGNPYDTTLQSEQ